MRESWDIIKQAQSVTGQPRQIYNGALLGVCVVFLATLLAVSGAGLDTPLQVAVFAFVIGIALLVVAVMSVAFDFSSGMSKPGGVLTTGVQIGGQIIGEVVGTVAVLVGITAVVGHLNAWAAIVGWGAFLVGSLMILVVALVYAARQQQAKPGNAPADGRPQP